MAQLRGDRGGAASAMCPRAHARVQTYRDRPYARALDLRGAFRARSRSEGAGRARLEATSISSAGSCGGSSDREANQPRSRQIFLARSLPISTCLGIADHW